MPDRITHTDAFAFHLTALGWRVAAAAALWIAGSWAIALARRACRSALAARRVDTEVIQHTETWVRVASHLVLLVTVMGVLGMQTTGLAALLVAAGIAIGAAWSGLLSNLAAGVFLAVLRPFRVGDSVRAGGITGEVRELGLFATWIDTPDNASVMIGNKRMLSGCLINYSVNPYRRVTLTAHLSRDIAAPEVIDAMLHALREVPNVVSTPAPQVGILRLDADGTVLTVQPCCHDKDYAQVCSDTNQVIEKVLRSARDSARLP